MKIFRKIPTALSEVSSLKELESLRAQIDQIDRQLISLFDERAALVFKVGSWKKRNSVAIHDPAREQKILEKVVESQRKNLADSEIQTLFAKMMEFFRLTEKARTTIEEAKQAQLLPAKARVGFLGFGLIGASVGLALREHFPAWDFLVYDPFLEINEFEDWNLKKAKSQFQIINMEQLRDMDFVFLAAPINVIQNLGPNVALNNKITLNMGSFQGEFENIFSFHPLAGKESSGYKQAQADLYYNKTICISLPKGESRAGRLEPWRNSLPLVEALAHILGAEILITDQQTHNEGLAYSSHLIQLMSLAYGETLKKNHFEEMPQLIPGTAKEFLRLNGSDQKMWEPILAKNHQSIIKAIADFQDKLNELKSELSADENVKLNNVFKKGHQVYENLYLRKKAK